MSAELSYLGIKSANQAREANEQRVEARKKNLLLLILHYFVQEGYMDSASTLEAETNLCLAGYEICDNVDLETVFQEYESYYHVRFQKMPKFIRKNVKSANEGRRQLRHSAGKQQLRERSSSLPKLDAESPHVLRSNIIPSATAVTGAEHMEHNGPHGGRLLSNGGKYQHTDPTWTGPSDDNSKSSGDARKQHGIGKTEVSKLELEGQTAPRSAVRRMKGRNSVNNEAAVSSGDVNSSSDASERLLKPLSHFLGYNSEWRELAQTITRDIYLYNPNVKWDDIIGLDTAKRLIKEAVVYPIKYPQLFTGILSPWKGLLLYGPPGTGKTLLAKAVATECKTTFFNISASSIVSKWRGDSEKLVRVLFELARYHAPSTIFLDELDSIMSQRGGSGAGEHEGSRRMKTELLVQMDGLAKTEDLVFLLAASNLPWELDHAMLRRLEKRIVVDLPSLDARKAMFFHHLPPTVVDKSKGLELCCSLDYDKLAKISDGYTGSDIKLVCKEAAMKPLRKVFAVLEEHKGDDPLPSLRLDEISTKDVEKALHSTKPSARNLAGKYVAWQQEYGSV